MMGKKLAAKMREVEFWVGVWQRIISLLPTLGIAVTGLAIMFGNIVDKKIERFESFMVVRIIHDVDKQFNKINNQSDVQDIKPEDLELAVIQYKGMPEDYQTATLDDKVGRIRKYYMDIGG